MTTVYLNGKFGAQRTTGVQRVASRLVQALSAAVPDATNLGPGSPWVLLCPPGAQALPASRIERREIGWPGLPLHLWEQVVLPFAARDGLLVSLGGTAPFFARRQIAMVHDAAVFDHPEAYTPAFAGWYRCLFHRLASTARLMTVSMFSRDRLAACLGVAADTISVVPNGADHLAATVPDDTVLDRLGLRHRRFLLAVGSANPTKNLAALVEAFGQLRGDPDVLLVVVGGRNERVFAAQPAATPNERVMHVGPLDDPGLKVLYQHAQALVFPSTYEGFGLPPLEAMACGCPVAASRAASIPEVCSDAVLYLDPLSTASIASAMQQLLDDAALRDRLRQAGLERARQFRWSDSARILRLVVAAGDSA